MESVACLHLRSFFDAFLNPPEVYDRPLILVLFTLLLPNLLIKAILLQDKLSLLGIVNNTTTILDDNLLHIIKINVGLGVALMTNGKDLSLENVLSHYDFIPLALYSL